MVSWQVTATTIYCEAVANDVTLMVYKDGTVRCTGRDKYARPGKETARLLKKKGKQLSRSLECDGSECRIVIQYKDRLFAEEAGGT